jgi:hypothetical protein
LAADLARSDERAAAAASMAVSRSLRLAVEVVAQQRAHAADGAVPLGFVEQLIDVDAQLPAVAQEALEGARQAAVVVAKVGAQHTIERLGRTLVHRLRALEQRFEFAAHHLDVQRSAGILDSQQADAQATLDQLGALTLGALGHELSQGPVGQLDVVYQHALAVDADGGGGPAPSGRKWVQASGFHGCIFRPGCATLRVTLGLDCRQ